MGKEDVVTKSGGSGLLMAGLVIVGVIAAGTYMTMQSGQPLTEDDLASVVPAVDTPAPADPQADGTPATPVQNDLVDESTTQAAVDPADVTEGKAVETDAGPEAVVAEEITPDVAAPSIDEVRLETGGTAVIAGRAAPGSDVEVVVDGDVIATARADTSGAFAALGTIDADDSARVLSLRATQDGQTAASVDEVIVAPIVAPDPEPAVSANVTETTQQVDTQAQDDAPQSDQAQASPEVIAGLVDQPETDGADVAQSLEQEQTSSEERVQQSVQTDTASEETTQQTAAATVPAPSQEAGTQPGADPVAQAAEQTEPTADVATEDTQAEPAPQIALLKSDEQGVTLLQTAPVAPARVMLDTIGYSDSGVVQLAGRASAEAVEVRIYLNNRAVISLPVDAQGNWRGEVPNVDAGVYTLRVDAVGAEGAVTSRMETPFKREEPQILAAATQGQTGPVRAVTVQAGDTLWAIARERYGEGTLYVRVFDANRGDIRDPDLIYPGQVFDLPDD